MHLPSSQPIFLTSTVIIPYCLPNVHPKHYPLFLVVSASIIPYFLLTCILIILHHLPNIHINYAVPSRSWSSKRPLSKRFSCKNTLCIPCLLHSTYIPSPSWSFYILLPCKCYVPVQASKFVCIKTSITIFVIHATSKHVIERFIFNCLCSALKDVTFHTLEKLLAK